MDRLSKYRAAITLSVCSICRKPDEDGVCDQTSREQCAIELYLDRIVEAVSRVHSGKYEDYVSALRETVCTHCGEGSGEYCDHRGTDVCMLDRYFPLIIEAVERVNAQP